MKSGLSPATGEWNKQTIPYSLDARPSVIDACAPLEMTHGIILNHLPTLAHMPYKQPATFPDDFVKPDRHLNEKKCQSIYINEGSTGMITIQILKILKHISF